MNKVAVMNEARARYRLQHDVEVRNQAKVSFEKHKNEKLFVAGTMLYWAEGTRLPAAATNRKYQLALTNSNPELVELYCKFLRRYFKNIESAVRAALFIYSDIDEAGAKLFWSGRLRIPLGQFIKTQILPNRGMPGKKKLPFGVCCVYLNSKDYCYRMESWINNISNYMRG